MVYELIDTILDKTASRQQKVGAIGANISRAPITKLELALQPQLQGCISEPPIFDCAVAK